MADDGPDLSARVDKIEKQLRQAEAQRERDRHPNAEMNAGIRDGIRRVKAERDGLAQPGDLLPTRKQILATHAELEAAGESCGIRPIAVALGSSPTVVHQRLGGKKLEHRNT